MRKHTNLQVAWDLIQGRGGGGPKQKIFMYFVKAHACYLKVYILYEWLAVYLDFIINIEE